MATERDIDHERITHGLWEDVAWECYEQLTGHRTGLEWQIDLARLGWNFRDIGMAAAIEQRGRNRARRELLGLARICEV